MPLLPGHPRQGHRWNDHRTVIGGILFRTRAGCPWRDLPERYGNWKTVYGVIAAWQTRAVAQQAEISNRLSQASVISNSSNNLRQIFLLFMEDPELRPYFYESKNPPSHGDKRTRLIVVSEMLGDMFEDGLVTHRLVRSIRSSDAWVKYCSTVLAASPILKEIMELHPDWWPWLRRLAPRTSGR